MTLIFHSTTVHAKRKFTITPHIVWLFENDYEKSQDMTTNYNNPLWQTPFTQLLINIIDLLCSYYTQSWKKKIRSTIKLKNKNY